ncbi:GNAT family N-acetyltransferase [Microbacterium flavum]|uniref:GNAT family N-acetyltransferase n=1 Tax=Microbacterium flavum TaxID=415216 RepID=A0ABS5XXX3_9MICO|nr:GNAT family N-acetyltransferase [Microbacterium flavum]MBT8797958.1 GNAT family N-acetyltransferase [Microbacterium flavum]
MSIAVREPVPADADAIADVHVATWREAYAHLLPEAYFSADYVARRHRMWAHVLGEARADMAVRIADDAGEIVGLAWAGPADVLPSADAAPPRVRALYALYVLADRYGTGVGQALLDAALDGEPAMLWVAKENPRATAFYRRNGFRFDGVEQTDPQAPSITDARMVR